MVFLDPIHQSCHIIQGKIVDPEGNVVRRGEKGELCTRGYSTMLGYWDDDKKTRAAISPTQWYHTG